MTLPIAEFEGVCHHIEPLDDALLARLQAARDYPSVTVLMTTVPASEMTSPDVIRLDRLVTEAGRRLAAELPTHDSDALLTRLRRVAAASRRQPARRALGLFVSHRMTAIVPLPTPVHDRVVVDPTFATRDLVRAMTLHPRYRLVTLSERTARILEGWPGQISERAIPELVVEAPLRAERHDRAHGYGRDRGIQQRIRTDAHFRQVAELVAARHAADPLPLVVAGVTRHVSAWRALPQFRNAVIGTIAGNHDHVSPVQLDRLARPVLDAHLSTGRYAALARLVAAHPKRRMSGIDAVWPAASAGWVDLLCVEDSFVFPACPDATGLRLEPAIDLRRSDVLDDAVDEVIEMVTRSGGEVVVVDGGTLDRFDRIAAVTSAR